MTTMGIKKYKFHRIMYLDINIVRLVLKKIDNEIFNQISL